MSPSTINTITNVVAFLLFVLEPVRAYLSSQTFDWTTFALCVGGAIISYFTGKSGVQVERKLNRLAKKMKVDPHEISGEN